MVTKPGSEVSYHTSDFIPNIVGIGSRVEFRKYYSGIIQTLCCYDEKFEPHEYK